MEQREIIYLEKEQWKGTIIMLETRNDSFYDVEIQPLNHDGCDIKLVRKQAETVIIHTPDEYDYPDRLYEDYRIDAEAYGVVGDDGELLACIEVSVEEWSNRLIVDELWVDERIRHHGYGKRLMDKAKEIAQVQKRRAIMLETQSFNAKAIDFYMSQGFQLIGLDTCCYSNQDVERRYVRFNLGYFFE